MKVCNQKLEAGVVCAIEFRCDTPGPEIEEGAFVGFWTGEIDTWGKMTFQIAESRTKLYLFPREIVCIERLYHGVMD